MIKVVVLLSLLFCVIFAQVTSDDITSILNKHNTARALKCQPPLIWDATIASVAQAYANKCIWGHNDNRHANYSAAGYVCPDGNVWTYCSYTLGENIAASTGGTVGDLVQLWLNEESGWPCPTYTSDAGHYTQVIWSDTKKVGCGKATCSGLGTYLVCDYYVPGNFNTGTRGPITAANCTACSGATGSPTSAVSSAKTSASSAKSTTKTTAQSSNTAKTSATTAKATTSTSSGTPTLSTYWSAAVGALTDWSLSATNSLSHLLSTLSVLTLNSPVATTTDGTDIFVVANITPGSSTSYGIVLNGKNDAYGYQYISFRFDKATSLYFLCYNWVNYPGSMTCVNFTATPNNLLKVRHQISGTTHKYTGYVGSTQLMTYYFSNTWGGGVHGLYAKGNEVFQNFYVRTPTGVKFGLSTCSLTTTDIANLVANQLQISVSSVVGIEKFGCAKKRENQAVETVSAVIVGTDSQTSFELAQQLVSNPDPLMSDVTIQSTAGGPEVGASSLSAPSIAAPLSAGAIAGIVVGSVAAAGAIGVGIYFGVKKSNENTNVVKKTSEESKGEEVYQNDTQIPIPKIKKGVDVFNLDPNTHQSITVRNPGIVNQ